MGIVALTAEPLSSYGLLALDQTLGLNFSGVVATRNAAAVERSHRHAAHAGPLWKPRWPRRVTRLAPCFGVAVATRIASRRTHMLQAAMCSGVTLCPAPQGASQNSHRHLPIPPELMACPLAPCASRVEARDGSERKSASCVGGCHGSGASYIATRFRRVEDVTGMVGTGQTQPPSSGGVMRR